MTEYEYDYRNRLAKEVWYDSQTPVWTISYEYDANSNLAKVTDPTATYDYGYDYLNRRTDTTQGIAGLTPEVEFAYGYDAASRMTSLGAAIDGTDDYLNSYTYDRLGQITYMTQDGQSGGHDVLYKYVSLGHNAAGQLITGMSRMGDEGYAGTSYTYDKAGRLTQIDHEALNFAGGSYRISFAETHTYTYDAAGRVTDYTSSFDGVDADYTYDATDQLTGADYTTLTDEAYTYDANGNRVGSGVEIGAYNRLLADGTYRYEYDGEGNRTRRYVDDDQSGTFNAGDTDVTEYTWDYRNRLVTVASYDEYEGDLTQQVDYSYDAHNQLVKRTVDPDGATGSDPLKQTIYVSEGGQVVLQFDKAGSGSLAVADLAHRHLWNPEVVDQLFGDERVGSLTNAAANELFWALTDRQGSITAVVDDATGGLRLHRTFDSFGNIVEETHYSSDQYGYSFAVNEGDPDYVDLAFAYTGRLLDQYTGLQNNLNRWYDASTGRWLSEDPIGFSAGDANLYRYVGNGPTNGTDPSGLAWWNPWDWCEYWFPPVATQGPVGASEAAGALEAAPGILRTADIQRAREKWQRSIGTPQEDAAWRDYEAKKRLHKDRFLPK